MSAFEHLHPALQHHIVNSLGWASLRPLQEHAIAPLLSGDHAMILGPTAGGKTEAAFLPLLSRMLAEDWRGLSLLYVCPIRALLNNLEVRLARYAELVGRRVELWHGDVGDATRRQIRRDPPDVLLTTPESLEVMLVSRLGNRRALFERVAAVVVDELHAFAGDDRGWHLLAVLARIERLAGRELQRVGLSATIGNAKDLLDWLAGHAVRPRRVIDPGGEPSPPPDVTLDYVGSLGNAAKVVGQLHRGQKRLVFVDSRARVEELGAMLRTQGVATFVTHSSLSAEERRRAETAFAEGTDCVVVATSALELGIDVGDLDHVFQVDAPTTVAAFLQRMGRTGRRRGSRRNCLFLATSEDAFLRAAGLIQLWADGYVEPVIPPAEPYHIFAQQLLALALQEGRIGRSVWREWIGRVPAFAAMHPDDLTAVVDHMLGHGVLFEESGLLSIGPEGERSFGYRNFLELFSVFTTPPLVTVLYGRTELGQVHDASFASSGKDETILLLGGRNWRVTSLDWARRLAYVEPTELHGRSRWLGHAGALHFDLCRAIRRVLVTGRCPGSLTARATEHMAALPGEFPWVADDATTLVHHPDGTVRWWTFAGLRTNAALGAAINATSDGRAKADNFGIPLPPDTDLAALRVDLGGLMSNDVASRLPVPSEALKALKFALCLPEDLAQRTVRGRLVDTGGITTVLSESVRAVTVAGERTP